MAQKVLDALKGKFPNAVVRTATSFGDETCPARPWVAC